MLCLPSGKRDKPKIDTYNFHSSSKPIYNLQYNTNVLYTYYTTIERFSKMTWVKVAHKSEIGEKKGKEINIKGTRIALFHANGKFYAIEALCRHQDGSLAPGQIDGEVVECPLHSWHYNIRTGELLDYLSGVKLTTYNVDTRGNDVYIDV
jgi:3-phenylpropionate/trans-cinnamate dioxygenase ferredoxin component